MKHNLVRLAALAALLAAAVVAVTLAVASEPQHAMPRQPRADLTVDELLGAAPTGPFGYTSWVTQLTAIPGSADRVRASSAVDSGAYHAVLVPQGFQGVPANVAAPYNGPPLTVRSTYVGRDSAEPTIGVDQLGRAFFAASTFDGPANEVARTLVMRSTDDNQTWQAVSPDLANTTEPPASADPYLYVDPDTNRVYSGDLLALGIEFIWSDDGGQTWTRGVPVGADVPVDHQTFLASKVVSPFVTNGYPKLFFYCSNQVGASTCARSLDGGNTFHLSGEPAFPGVQGATVCGGLTGHLETDSAGRLFLPRFYCGLSLAPPAVAISSDGGVTWTRVQINSYINMPYHEVAIAVDSADNVYATFWDATNHLPYLSISTDHGLTWSTPRMIAPPGVHEVNFPDITAGDAGRIAIEFPGSTVNNQSDPTRPWNHYVLVSTDALGSDPLFVWTTTNDTTDPVHRGNCTGRCGGMYDFLDIQTSPKDSRFWATLSDTCIGACVTNPSGGQISPGQGVAIVQTGGPSLAAGPTAVDLLGFTAREVRGGVRLSWRTASEAGLRGFYVHRGAVTVNRWLVLARGAPTGARYSVVDRTVKPGRAYTYRLEVVGMNGTRATRATVVVRT